MFDFIYNTQICSELISQAPVNLILYTHIPSTIIALLIGILVLVKNKSLLGKILFGITAVFSLWTVVDLITWLSTNSILTTIAWSFFGLFTALISILSFYFFYVFLSQKDLKLWSKFLIFLPIIPIIILTPTIWNVSNFDLVACEATDNINFVTYYYILGALAMVGVFFLTILNWNNKKKIIPKTEVVLMFLGLEVFLSLFLFLGYFSSYFDNYQIEFYGLFGMVIFMAFFAFIIVRFKAFNIGLIGAQALVVALIIVIGSEFLFVESNTNTILIAATLVITGIIGLVLIRSVKKEISQREKIESLAQDLKKANEGQVNLMHIMNHQIKGRLGVAKNIFAELMTDDYGVIPAEAKPMLQKGLEETDIGVNYVQNILKGMSAETGTLPYKMEKMDFRTIVQEVADKQKEYAQKKNLAFTLDIKEGDYTMQGDAMELRESIRNVIDNSINYTLQGSIAVSLERKGNNILFTVKDTGVGIDAEDKAKLFKTGGRGKDSIKINVNSTGYGLAFVKGVVEAHKGRVWAESEGKGKGSQFYIELPQK